MSTLTTNDGTQLNADLLTFLKARAEAQLP